MKACAEVCVSSKSRPRYASCGQGDTSTMGTDMGTTMPSADTAGTGKIVMAIPHPRPGQAQLVIRTSTTDVRTVSDTAAVGRYDECSTNGTGRP